MLSLQLFSHSEIFRTFVQGFIGLDGLFDLISDSHEEQASIIVANSDLSDDFIEALAEEFLPNRA